MTIGLSLRALDSMRSGPFDEASPTRRRSPMPHFRLSLRPARVPGSVQRDSAAVADLDGVVVFGSLPLRLHAELDRR